MKDLRDPIAVGAALLCARAVPSAKISSSCAMAADRYIEVLEAVPNYTSDLGPLEKYGDPTTLPSTMP